jgi:DNA repair protein SbcD/Mre11
VGQGGRGSDFSFVHAADLHLGGRLWLTREPLHDALKATVGRASELAFASLVDRVLETDARFLVCAGDVFDRWCRDFTVALRFVEQLLRLRGRCQVALLLGNHDAHARLLKHLLLPDFVYVLGRRAPETRFIPELRVALHGFSTPDVEPGTDVVAHYPPPIPQHFNIGVLHTSAEGRHGHHDYAPCSRRSLRRHGYDYWALGHVHTREVLSTEPWVVFPGNLQARGAREAGAKGATWVQVAGGAVRAVEHHAVDVVRFEDHVIETRGVRNFGELLNLLDRHLTAESAPRGRPVAMRVVLSGEDGAAVSMGVPEPRRQRALAELIEARSTESLWVDDVFLDAGSALGRWPLLRAG